MVPEHTPRNPLGETPAQRVEHYRREVHEGLLRAVEGAWCAGRALREQQELLGARKFAPWLESISMARSTAYKWMALSELSLDALESVDSIEGGLLEVKALSVHGIDRYAPQSCEPDKPEKAVHRSAERKRRKVRERAQEEEQHSTHRELAEHYREEAAEFKVRAIPDPDEAVAEAVNELEAANRDNERLRTENARLRKERDDALAQAAYSDNYARGLEKRLEGAPMA